MKINVPQKNERLKNSFHTVETEIRIVYEIFDSSSLLSVDDDDRSGVSSKGFVWSMLQSGGLEYI